MKIKLVVIYQFLLLIFARGIFCDFSSPLFESYYDGNGDRVIAKSVDAKITERQIYLYLLVKNDNPAYLYESYLKSKTEKDFKHYESSLKKEIEDYFINEHLSKGAIEQKEFDNLEKIKIHISLYPIYDLVWISRYFIDPEKPLVTVLPEDIKKYYIENKSGEFKIPERIHIRYIFIKSPSVETAVEREKIKSSLEDVRSQSKPEEIFAEYAKKLSQSPSAKDGGEIPVSAKGTLSPDFEEAAFSLRPGEISKVIELSDGFYLIYCKNKFEPSVYPLNEVAQKIKDKLFLKFLKLHYEYELEKLTKKYRPKSEFYLWDFIDSDDPVLSIRDFKITKNELLYLFPEILPNNQRLNWDLLGRKCFLIIRQEMVAREVRRNKWLYDERILEGEKIAKKELIANKIIQTEISKKLILRDNDLLDFYNQNLETFRKISRKKIYHIWGTIPKPEEYTKAQNAVRAKNLETILNKLTKDVLERLKKEPILSKDNFPIIPQAKDLLNTSSQFEAKILTPVLKEYQKNNTKFIFGCKNLKEVNMEESPDLKELLKDTHSGEFSKVHFQGTTASIYFVESEDTGEGKSFEYLKPYVQSSLVEKIKKEETEKIRNQILKNYPIEFMLGNPLEKK